MQKNIPYALNNILDCHAHIVSGDVTKYPLARKNDPEIDHFLTDPFDAQRLEREMAVTGVSGAVLVQRRQLYGFDNSYVCAVAAENPNRWKTVCAIDAERESAGMDVVQWSGRGATGFRLMAPISHSTFDWLDGSNTKEFWRVVSEVGVLVCVHFFPWNRDEGLVRLMRLLKTYPLAQVTIDHLTNAPIPNGMEGGIDDRVRRLADFEAVTLKLTTIPLRALDEHGIDASSLIAQYIELFGEDRLMWGSDVAQSQGNYQQLVEYGRNAVSGLKPAIAAKLMTTNTARLYGFSQTPTTPS
jgi:predicted TIM-barrel fold metal-dependent hydrolase